MKNNAVILCAPEFLDSDLFWKSLTALGYTSPPPINLLANKDGKRGLPANSRSIILHAATEAKGYLSVVLAGFGPTERVPGDVLDLLSATAIKGFFRLSESGEALLSHRPLQSRLARTLVVFPGAVIPVKMGAHRRVFQLCRNLADHDHPVDLLVAAQPNTFAKAKPFLEQISASVFRYNIPRTSLRGALFWRRLAENAVYRLRGFAKPGPTFSENLYTKPKYSGRKMLRRLAESGRYNNIIVSYAWMDRIRSLVPPSIASQIRWFCDTHDIQYVRNGGASGKVKRAFISAAKEKKRELGILKTYEKALAISAGDTEVLKKDLGAKSVILAPNGFDYLQLPLRLPRGERPVFGFIGRDMEANRLALDYILHEWWPAIVQRWPQATLRIGGSVASHDTVRKKAILDSSIRLEPDVADLIAWYDAIDVLVNPVVVRGGLNYKSVEAAVAGRLLLTNKRGLECFGGKPLGLVAESGNEAVEELVSFWEKPEAAMAFLEKTQKEAQTIFGDETALQELLIELERAERPTNPGGYAQALVKRVLIHVGDSHENRQRLLPLARALKDRGHHPVMLVYDRQHIPAYVAAGIDAVALYDFNETRPQRLRRIIGSQRIRKLAQKYRGFDLDDVSDVDQLARPDRFSGKKLRGRINEITMNLDRVLRVNERVRPDCLVVWNGHTGYPANALRCLGYKLGIPMFFAERSVFPDGVFIDPRGVNGNSELASMGAKALADSDLQPARASSTVTPAVTKHQVDLLRASGPWSTAQRIVFVPLQVQKDTNILLHSPNTSKMDDLVRAAHATYGTPETAIVVRPHPEEVDKDVKIPKLPNVYVDDSGDLQHWLELADVVVTVNSTVGLSALLRGKRVLSLGRGIFTGVGLTDGTAPDGKSIEKLWGLLTRRYTSLPECPLPECMADAFPTLPRSATPKPVNPLGLDPSGSMEACLEWVGDLRAQAIQCGVLELFHDLTPTDTLHLTYRKTHEAITTNHLAESAKKQLGLANDFPVRLKKATGEKHHIFRAPHRADSHGFDRYMWPIASCGR